VAEKTTEEISRAGISHAQMVDAICVSTQDVFGTMLGLEIAPQPAYVDKTASGPAEGVVSLIGLAGKWVGTGSVSCSAPFAIQISSQLLMSEFQAVDAEVLDAVAEVTNMIIGNVKTVIEETLGPLGLSIPTVIYGRNFTTRSVGNNEWVVVPFLCGTERMDVQLCLAPARGAAFPRPALANPEAVHA
jgi:chemotaxis protein CheX